jgi:hypothetical protein
MRDGLCEGRLYEGRPRAAYVKDACMRDGLCEGLPALGTTSVKSGMYEGRPM